MSQDKTAPPANPATQGAKGQRPQAAYTALSSEAELALKPSLLQLSIHEMSYSVVLQEHTATLQRAAHLQ